MAEVTITVQGVNDTAAAFAGVKKGAKEAFDSVKKAGGEVSDRLQKDFETLGIKSASDMDAAKTKINKSFDSIKNSGVATSDEIVRAERARASEIEKIDKENFSRRKGMLDNFKKHWLKITAAFVIATAVISPIINIVGTLEEGWIGVAKTTGMAGEEMAGFKKEIRELSVELKGVKIESLQEIAEGAGQLGIRGVENLKAFTETIAKVAVATDLTTEAATRDFASIANVMHEPISNMERMGSVINELSNTTNAYASDISNLTKRISGAGATIKLTTPEIMGLAATMKDLGIETEVGGTAMSQVLQKMLVDTEKFAKVANLDLKTFSETVMNEPVAALKMLLESMSKMSKFEAAASLSELGLEGVRVGGVLLKLSGGMGKLEKNLKTANDEWEKATSLQIEYETASKSMFAEATSVSNAFKIIADELAESFLPAIKQVLKFVRLSALGMLSLGKAIGTGLADMSLGFRNLHQEPTKLERLNSSIKLVTKGLAKLREEGRFPTAILRNEEKLNTLLEERQRLLKPAEKTATKAIEPPKKIKSETEIKAEVEANKKALTAQEKHLGQRLNAWEGYFSKLKSMRSQAASDQKRLAKEILALEKQITDQRQGFAEMIAAMNVTAFGDSRSEMQKYYDEQDRLDNKLAAAMQLSGQARIDALVKFQQASADAAREVSEDGDVILSLQSATMEAMERVEEAQSAIVAAQDALLEKKKEEKAAVDVWIKTLDDAMARARTEIEDYQGQIDKLQTTMSSLGMDVDTDQAISAIDEVKGALDAIPDVTTKTVFLETITSGGGPVATGGVPSAPVVSGAGSADPGAPFGTFSNFAVGTRFVSKTGLAQVHQGEEVRTRGEVRQDKKAQVNFGGITIPVTVVGGEAPEQQAKKLVRHIDRELKNLKASYA